MQAKKFVGLCLSSLLLLAAGDLITTYIALTTIDSAVELNPALNKGITFLSFHYALAVLFLGSIIYAGVATKYSTPEHWSKRLAGNFLMAIFFSCLAINLLAVVNNSMVIMGIISPVQLGMEATFPAEVIRPETLGYMYILLKAALFLTLFFPTFIALQFKLFRVQKFELVGGDALFLNGALFTALALAFTYVCSSAISIT
ncbi:hypothetical protein [Haliea sp. E17]|uniref:hypothetical protein n=1 Tax=Haliea sp. E17 TaxID=3401576 RepID=UPI003AAC75E7